MGVMKTAMKMKVLAAALLCVALAVAYQSDETLDTAPNIQGDAATVKETGNEEDQASEKAQSLPVKAKEEAEKQASDQHVALKHTKKLARKQLMEAADQSTGSRRRRARRRRL